MLNIKRDLKIGTWVRWNGAGPGRRPRWYTGMVMAVNDGIALVIDNEWYAASAVPVGRLFPPLDAEG